MKCHLGFSQFNFSTDLKEYTHKFQPSSASTQEATHFDTEFTDECVYDEAPVVMPSELTIKGYPIASDRFKQVKKTTYSVKRKQVMPV